MNQYRVIWFDDQCDDLPLIKEKAKLSEISLIGFGNASQGIEELRRNIRIYDAAIIDGLFYMEPDEFNSPIDDAPFFKVAMEINKLESVKVLPWFILSGQFGFTKEKNRYAEGFKDNKVYDKNKDEHLDSLWRDIKQSASQQLDTQIRHDHQEIFSIFSSGYLPAEIELQVLELLKAELPVNRVQIKSMLSNIRSIHESCILKFEEIKVIPDSQVQFSNVVKHLSGNKTHPTYLPTTKEYQNASIENLNKWLYFTCGQYIHNLKDENYKDYMISKYAVESLRTGLLELLLWFKKTYEENK